MPLLEQYTRTITRPVYLIELGFTPPLYLSNAGNIQWDGHYWQSASIDVGQIDNDAVGGQTVSIRIANHDRIIGALVLSQIAQDRDVRIWAGYDDLTQSPPILFAEGVMDGASVGEYVDIAIISKSTAYGSTPRILCGPPLFNHLPQSGTTLKAGHVTITLRSR